MFLMAPLRTSKDRRQLPEHRRKVDVRREKVEAKMAEKTGQGVSLKRRRRHCSGFRGRRRSSPR
jgi:hypothetical protein